MEVVVNFSSKFDGPLSFFDRLYTDGVENPEFPSRDPSREVTSFLKKPFLLLPKAGVSTSFRFYFKVVLLSGGDT